MPQFSAFLECLFQTIAARLGAKASLRVMCYWSIQFCTILAAMSAVESCLDHRSADSQCRSVLLKMGSDDQSHARSLSDLKVDSTHSKIKSVSFDVVCDYKPDLKSVSFEACFNENLEAILDADDALMEFQSPDHSGDIDNLSVTSCGEDA